jgi:hypothetical protein
MTGWRCQSAQRFARVDQGLTLYSNPMAYAKLAWLPVVASRFRSPARRKHPRRDSFDLRPRAMPRDVNSIRELSARGRQPMEFTGVERLQRSHDNQLRRAINNVHFRWTMGPPLRDTNVSRSVSEANDGFVTSKGTADTPPAQ